MPYYLGHIKLHWYIYGFKDYVLLMNLSLNLIGVILKGSAFLIWNGLI